MRQNGHRAGVAELVDALDSKSGAPKGRVGSSPTSGTNLTAAARVRSPCPLRGRARGWRLVGFHSRMRLRAMTIPSPYVFVGRTCRRGALRMTVRLLGLNCSPRDNSNSSIMLDTAFEKLDATYPGECEHGVVHLRDLHVEPCKACNVCGKKKDGTFIPVRAREGGRRPGRARRHGRRRRHHRGHAGVLRAAERPVQQVHHAHAPAAPPGLQARQQAGRRARHGGAPLRRGRDGDPGHLAAVRAQRLPGGRQRRRQLPVRRLGLGWCRADILSDEWGLEQAFQTAQRVFTLAGVLKAGVEASGYQNYMRFSYSQGTRT